MVAAIGAVAAVAGGAISASGARSAAGKQSDAAYAEIEAQERQAAQMREDLSPWVSAGVGAQNRLSQFLGIGGGAGGSAGRGYTEAELRDMLTAQFTTTTPGATNRSGAIPVTIGPNDPRWDWNQPSSVDRNGEEYVYTQQVMQPVSSVGQGGSTVNTEALNAEVQRRLQEQQAAQQAYESDPAYGSLLRAYRDGAEFDSGPAFERGADFSFTGKDLASEPGYQFGLDQGTKGINRGQAARGNFLSGAAMKELARFNEDYAGTKFNEGFNRSLNTYNTNQTGRLNEYNTNLTRRQNEWNTNLAAYNDNRNRIYNFLSGTSSAGQNAAAQVGNNAQQVANNVTNLATGAANASAAGTIAGSNALASGLNQAINSYRSNNNSTNNLNSAAGWNSLISQGGSAYGNSGASFSGTNTSPYGGVPNNYFSLGGL